MERKELSLKVEVHIFGDYYSKDMLNSIELLKKAGFEVTTSVSGEDVKLKYHEKVYEGLPKIKEFIEQYKKGKI